MSLKRKLQPEPIVCSVKQTAALLDTRKDKKEAFYRELHCIKSWRGCTGKMCVRDWEQVERKRRQFKAKPVRHYSCISKKATEKESTVPRAPKLPSPALPSTSNLH